MVLRCPIRSYPKDLNACWSNFRKRGMHHRLLKNWNENLNQIKVLKGDGVCC